jgi:hypothetical protein
MQLSLPRSSWQWQPDHLFRHRSGVVASCIAMAVHQDTCLERAPPRRRGGTLGITAPEFAARPSIVMQEHPDTCENATEHVCSSLFRVHHGNGSLIICFVTGAVSLRPLLQWQFTKTPDNSFVKEIFRITLQSTQKQS